MYAIKQTYWNHKGQYWQKIISKRYKTWRNAEKTASRSYRFICRNQATGEVLEKSSADVVEVKP